MKAPAIDDGREPMRFFGETPNFFFETAARSLRFAGCKRGGRLIATARVDQFAASGQRAACIDALTGKCWRLHC
jgi:hypothetical protein